MKWCDDNQILSEFHSDKIWDKNKQYVGFFEETCKEYYKVCKDVEFLSPSQYSKYNGNIIRGQDRIIYFSCNLRIIVNVLKKINMRVLQI